MYIKPKLFHIDFSQRKKKQMEFAVKVHTHHLESWS